MVMMGGLPGLAGGFPRSCHDEPAGGNGNRYFGHFDCAEGHVCPVGATRVGCLRGPLFAARFGGLPDTRVVPGHPNQVASNNPIGTRWVEYDPAAGTCTGGHTGMVWTGPASFGTDVGSPTKQLDVYVMGNWGQGSDRKFYGTLAVEGTIAGGPVFSLGNGASAQLWSGPSTAAAAGWGFSRTYGYPLVAVVYNPVLAPPTIQPTYGPQPLTADFGPGNAQIHGIIASSTPAATSSSDRSPSTGAWWPLRSGARAAPATPTTPRTATTRRRRASRSGPATGSPSSGDHS
jgi:hypothetical protein